MKRSFVRNSRSASLSIMAWLLWPAALLACLWDYDSLLQERSRFPDTLELITGKFLRHSKEFYEWRIKDRLAKLKANPKSLADYDDLAVAYEKTGDHQKAIETILAKDRIKPGLYETEANLGTFYLHAGQPEQGLAHIGRAIQINPNAHFGREKYQKLVGEYILERCHGGPLKLPLSPPVNDFATARDSFQSFLMKEQKLERLGEQDRAAAIHGILGMMRFGNYDSPVLLECLANLLSGGRFENASDDAKRLAARAYLQASYVVKDEAARSAYRSKAEQVLKGQTRHPGTTDELKLPELEKQFGVELEEARTWYAGVRSDEIKWIREGKNADEEFVRAYFQEPKLVTADDSDSWIHEIVTDNTPALAVLLAVVIGSPVLMWRLIVWRRRRTAMSKDKRALQLRVPKA